MINKTLENLVNQFGLSNVLLQLTEICNEKAKNIREDILNQDVTTNQSANEWELAGEAIDMIAQLNVNIQAVSDLCVT